MRCSDIRVNCQKEIGIFSCAFLLFTAIQVQAQWELVGFEDHSVLALFQHPSDENILFATINPDTVNLNWYGLARTEDRGNEWITVLPPAFQNRISTMSYASEVGDTILGSGVEYFWSTDYGQSWSIRETNIPSIPSQAVSVQHTGIDRNVIFGRFTSLSENLFYISYDGGAIFDTVGGEHTQLGFYRIERIPHTGHLYTLAPGQWSTDGGETWTTSDTTIINIYDISTSSSTDSVAVAALSRRHDFGVWTDEIAEHHPTGNYWSTLFISVDAESEFQAVSVNPVNENIIFAAQSDILWRTFDRGTTWHQVTGHPFDGSYIRDLMFSNSGQELYVGVQITFSFPNGGLWRLDLSSGATEMLNPRNPRFCQVYPNPFNSITTLTLSLPGVSDVDIGLYDITGRYVKDVAQGRMAAGEHAISVDAAGLPSGVYFVRAAAGEAVMARKVVLLK